MFRPRPVRVATAPGAEEELFIRRHAEKPSKKVEKVDKVDKVEEQFDFVSEQKENTHPSQPKRPDTDVFPDLKPPPPPPPEVVPATTPPRVSTSDTKRQQKTKTETENTHGEKRIHVVAPKASNMAKQIRGEFTRLISESSVGSQVRIPTGRETITAVWELVVVFAILVLLRAGVASTLRWIHNRLNTTRGLKSNIPYEASVFECMQRPLEFLSLFTVGTALAEAISRPLAATGLLRHIMTLRELGIIFSATWFLLRWIDRIRSRFAVDKRIDKAQVDATSRIATVATFVVSLLISLDTIGINVQTVLAFGGIGGVAIGFAGREIISNFFGGFMIYVTRPFSVGEWIRSIEEAELNGTVEDIGWYLTRVRTWDKRPLYIPNSRFSTLIVENGSRMANRRILHTLHLRHEDMPVLPQIIKDVEKLLMTHPELDPRQHRLAYIDSFDEFSVKLWLSCYTKSVFLYDFRRVQQDVLVKFYDIVRARGAKLATRNTRDVRPGVDTDRYGPFGSAATFGEAVAGQTAMENIPVSAPPNSDVPGAPRFGIPQPMEPLHTIESGIDLSKLTQPAVPNGVPAAQPVGDVVPSVSSADSEPKRKQTPLSNAAVAATAAAFLAARRNALRKEGTRKSPSTDVVQLNVDSPDTPSAASEVRSVTPQPPGEMKISAAPPRSSTTASGAPNTASPSEGSGFASAENRSVDEPTSPVGAISVGSSLSGKSMSESSNSPARTPTGTTTPPSAPVGEMKITKARNSTVTPGPPSSSDEVGEPPLPEAPPALTKKSSDETHEKPQAVMRSTDERPSVRSMQPSSSTGEDASSSSGLMKITAAPPAKSTNLSTNRKIDEADGNRIVAEGLPEIPRSSSVTTKNGRNVITSNGDGAQSVSTNRSPNSATKVTGTRPGRPLSVSINDESKASTGSPSKDEKSRAPPSNESHSADDPPHTVKAVSTSQQSITDRISSETNKDAIPLSIESDKGSKSPAHNTNGMHANAADAVETKQTIPSPTSELENRDSDG